MPKKKYIVETDKGSYEVEVQEPDPIQTQGGPGTFQEGFHEALKKEPVAGAALGYVEGFPRGVANAVTGIPSMVGGVIKQGILAAMDTGNLMLHPDQVPEAIDRAYANIKGMFTSAPDKAKEWVTNAQQLATTDPEAFGKMVGELTGGVDAGIAAGGTVNLTKGAVGRGVGGAMENAGRLSRFPLTIAGSHAILSGNPAGIGMVLAPGALTKTGRALRLASTAEGAVAGTFPSRLLQMRQELANGAKSPAALQAEVEAMHADLATRRAAAKVPEEVAALTKEYNQLEKVSDRINAAVSNASTAERLATERAGMKPAVSHTQSESAKGPSGEKISKTTKFTEADPDEVPGGPPKGWPKGVPYDPSRISQPKAPVGGMKLAPSHTPVPAAAAAEIAPVASHAAGPEFVAPGEEAAFNAAQPPSKVPVAEIPANKTSRMMSKTPGLSAEDMKLLGLNPDIVVKGLSKNAVDRMLQERLLREKMYRETYGLDQEFNRVKE